MRLIAKTIVPVLFSAASLMMAEERPNVILIFVDDHGYTDIGIHGFDPDVRTPELDQLARDGVLFTNGYVTAPQCVPSRAGLLTGRHQNVFGMDGNHDGPLPLSEITIADRLQQAGYATGMIGKWHLDVLRNSSHPEWDGSREPEDLARYFPRSRGFEDYWFGSINNYEVNFLLDGRDHPNAPAMVEDNRQRVDVQTEAALAFLNRRKDDDRPFFLYLAWFAPHAPMATPPQLTNGINGQNFWQEFAHVEETERRRALAIIRSMDYGLGLIRERLQEMGVAENTLIFFISDNGAPLRGRAYIGSRNEPLVGEKGMQTDGGQRVPYIMAWPGTIPGGQVFEEMVCAMDASATTLAVAGAPIDERIEGVNLMPWLTGEKSGPVHEALYWRWRSQAAVLSDGWKFIRLGNENRYLFEMSELGKQTAADNKIEQYPELAQRLETLLRERADTWFHKGLPDEVHQADRLFFDQHVEQTLPPLTFGETAPRRAPGPERQAPAQVAIDTDGLDGLAARIAEQPQLDSNDLSGWTLRNATAHRVGAGVLGIVPEVGARHPAFFTRAGLELTPPVTLEMEVRSPDAALEIRPSWRVREPGNRFHSDPATVLSFQKERQIQTLRTILPATGPVIHLRISLPADFQSGVIVRRITLTDANGETMETVFLQD